MNPRRPPPGVFPSVGGRVSAKSGGNAQTIRISLRAGGSSSPWPSRTAGARPGLRPAEIALLFDDLGVQQTIDFPLDCRTFIIALVDRPREFDEIVVEFVAHLLSPDQVFNFPQGLVDVGQPHLQNINVDSFRNIGMHFRLQQLQFLDHVCASTLVLQARAFDFEDRDLVDQFSPRDGDLRSFHPDLSGLMHLDAVCSTTATSMVLGPMSLLAAAAEIRKRRRCARLGDWRTSAAAQEVSSASYLEHDPEKWIPVFGKDHAPPVS